MPTTTAIREMTLRANTVGFDQARAALEGMASAQNRVAESAGIMAVATDTSSKRAISASAALERQARAADPLYAAQQKLIVQQAQLQRGIDQGQSSTRAFQIAQAAFAKGVHDLAEATGKSTAAHVAHGAAIGLNTNKLAELHHVARAVGDELMAGRSLFGALGTESGRLIDIFGPGAATLSKFAGGLAAIPAGAYAAAGALAVGTAATLSYLSTQDRMAASLDGVGRRAGMTLGQLNKVAEAGSRAAGISLGDARGLAMGYAQHGLDADTSQSLIGASRRYGEITGQGTAEAGTKLGEIFEAPAAGLKELDRTFGLLDGRLQTTVDRLTAQGDMEGARRVAMDAYLKAQSEITDRTWSFAKALHGAETSVGGWFEEVGRSLASTFGVTSDADKLAQDRNTVANLSKADPVGNADYIGELRAEIARLERSTNDESARVRAEGEAAKARELSTRVDAGLRSALPDVERTRALEDRLALLGRGLNTPGVAASSGFGGADMRTAYDRTAVQLANIDPFARMVQDAKLATAGVEAYTLAERAAVDARRAELAVMREDGDVRRASLAARIAENQAITEANQRASDHLATVMQNHAMVGMTPAQRGLQEIENRYSGVGGYFDKDTATRRELTDAMQPVKNDLRSAADTIADAMKAAAATIAAATPGSSPFGTLDHSAFTGGTGAYAQPMFALMQRAIAAGATPAAAAGFAAGTSMESGTRLDPTSDNGSHLGVAQWDSARWRALVSKLGGGAMSTQAGQFNGIFAELGSNEAGAGRKLLAGQSVLDGIGASDAYERPGEIEAARRRPEALSRANALLAAYPGGKAGATLTIQGSSGTTAGVPLVASTARGDYSTALGKEKTDYRDALVNDPLKAANTSLDAYRANLAAEQSTLGQSASAIHAAADVQKLLNDYKARGVTEDVVGADRWRQLTAGVDAYRSKLGEAYAAEDRFHKQQRDLVSTMDDVRDAGRGFLDPLVQAGIHGTSVLSALRSGLQSIEGKIAGKLEDTAIDTLFGAKGTAGAGMFDGLGSVFSKLGGLSSIGSVGAATGGLITGPGTSTSDSIPARLSDGEFVVNAAATRANSNILHAINTTGRVPGFANGGVVGGMPVNSGSGGGVGSAGDVHIHNHMHVDGASGDKHVQALAVQAAQSVITHPGSAKHIAAAVRYHQQRRG